MHKHGRVSKVGETAWKIFQVLFAAGVGLAIGASIAQGLF